MPEDKLNGKISFETSPGGKMGTHILVKIGDHYFGHLYMDSDLNAKQDEFILKRIETLYNAYIDAVKFQAEAKTTNDDRPVSN